MSLGMHGRVGVAPTTDPREVEGQKFAREIAHELATARVDQRFDELVVSAPPQFLGLLRAELDEHVRGRVKRWLDKDLTKLPPGDIESHVRTELSSGP